MCVHFCIDYAITILVVQNDFFLFSTNDFNMVKYDIEMCMFSHFHLASVCHVKDDKL